MIFLKIIVISLSFFTFASYALDNQFVCTFGSTVKVASFKPNDPNPTIVKSEIEKYTFLIDSKNPLKASFINLSQGLKAPLHAMKNGNSYIFTESNTGTNHFVVSIFTDKKLSDGFSAVMSFHSKDPTDSNDFFAQSIRVGRCF
jgi:hypothetical protein